MDFKTYDMSLAAFLRSRAHAMKAPEKIGSRYLFAFDSTAQLKADVDLFTERMAQVEPVSFFSEIKALKSLIYAHKN